MPWQRFALSEQSSFVLLSKGAPPSPPHPHTPLLVVDFTFVTLAIHNNESLSVFMYYKQSNIDLLIDPVIIEVGVTTYL